MGVLNDNCKECKKEGTDECLDCSVNGDSCCSCHIMPPCDYCMNNKFEEKES